MGSKTVTVLLGMAGMVWNRCIGVFAAGKRVKEDTIIDDCKDKLSWFVKAFFSQADSLLGGMFWRRTGWNAS